MPSRRLIFRHSLLSLSFTVFYLLLNRPEVIFLSHLGFTIWFPATGLILALLLGISPWYAILAIFCDSLAGFLIYHQPLSTFGENVGALGLGLCYAAAAYILRGPLPIDLELRRRRDVLRYVLMSVAAALASTAVGVGCLFADRSIGRAEIWPSAISWFLGDGVALLGVAPFLLIHVLPWVRRHLEMGDQSALDASRERYRTSVPGGLAELVGQGLALLGVLRIVFGPPLQGRELFYLCFLPILWIAMRQGVRRVVTGLLVLNFGIVLALHTFRPTASLLARVGLLMLVFSAVGLIVGSAVAERHHIALELQERTMYLHSLIENSPLGIAVLDRQGRVELTNPAFERLFLYEPGELAGRDLDSMLALDGDKAKSLTPRVFAGQTVYTTAQRRRKDGKILDLELHAVPLEVNGQLRGAYTIYKDISQQVRAAESTRRQADSLSRLVSELQLRTNQMTLLNQMGDLLECCSTTKEACAVVTQFMQKLFPESLSGTLYLLNSRNAIEVAVRWGSPGLSEPSFPPQSCWALRRGQAHWSVPQESAIQCLHLPNNHSSSCLCVPMVGQEGTLGILHLEFPCGVAAKGGRTPQSLHDARQQLATTVAGQTAFSLTSLRLRETLRDQSIRDPLTGVFNRRFMEESLTRELQRATRKNQAVSVLYLDLDHFKHFNDTFGHDAGDWVLRAIADLFRRFFRADDVCCRYGGEEFAIILPESSSQYAAARANELRVEVKGMKLQYRDQTLGTLTLSVGVAAFPEHGFTAEELLTVADRCLYRSKAAGRDMVTVADQVPVA